MGQSTYLADGVQNACARLVVTAINHCHIGIILQCLLYGRKIRLLVHARLEVDVGNMVHLTNLDGAGVIGTVVDYQNLLAFGYQRVDADIDVDGS